MPWHRVFTTVLGNWYGSRNHDNVKMCYQSSSWFIDKYYGNELTIKIIYKCAKRLTDLRVWQVNTSLKVSMRTRHPHRLNLDVRLSVTRSTRGVNMISGDNNMRGSVILATSPFLQASSGRPPCICFHMMEIIIIIISTNESSSYLHTRLDHCYDAPFFQTNDPPEQVIMKIQVQIT